MIDYFFLALRSSAALTLLLYALYIVGIRYFRGGWWRLMLPVVLTAFFLDVLLNYTLFALLMWHWPGIGDYTFSKVLGTLYANTGWRGKVAYFIGRKLLDPFDPRGRHVFGKVAIQN